jgi:hypothetical protein
MQPSMGREEEGSERGLSDSKSSVRLFRETAVGEDP